MIELSLGEKLSKIQQEFKSKKSKFNSFGKYHYRSAEDILEALKPMNEKYSVYFTIEEKFLDQFEAGNLPPIIQSTATIWDAVTNMSIKAVSLVGVDLNQKGMQTPQQFGSASSYAKKYALGNLLLIDDTADPDASNKHGKDVPKPKKATKEDIEKAKKFLLAGGKMDSIKKKFVLTKAQEQELINLK